MQTNASAAVVAHERPHGAPTTYCAVAAHCTLVEVTVLSASAELFRVPSGDGSGGFAAVAS
jgi:hypothetical protein